MKDLQKKILWLIDQVNKLRKERCETEAGDCETCGMSKLVAVRFNGGEMFFETVLENSYLSSIPSYASQLEDVTYTVNEGPGLYEIENIAYFFGSPEVQNDTAKIKAVLRVNGVALELSLPFPPNNSLLYYAEQLARVSGNTSPMNFKFYVQLNQGDEVFVDYKKESPFTFEFAVDGIKTIVKKVNQI